MEILNQQRTILDDLAYALEKKEVLDGETVEAIIRRRKETARQHQEN